MSIHEEVYIFFRKNKQKKKLFTNYLNPAANNFRNEAKRILKWVASVL
jgi:hypothetical protein